MALLFPAWKLQKHRHWNMHVSYSMPRRTLCVWHVLCMALFYLFSCSPCTSQYQQWAGLLLLIPEVVAVLSYIFASCICFCLFVTLYLGFCSYWFCLLFLLSYLLYVSCNIINTEHNFIILYCSVQHVIN